MYRLPNQFDVRPQRVADSAAGGGSCTTCSSCVVTVVGMNILTARHFTKLARNAPLLQAQARASAHPESQSDLSAMMGQAAPPSTVAARGPSGFGWGVLGFFLLPLAVGVGFLPPLYVFGGLAVYTGGFALAYAALKNNGPAGLFYALAMMVVLVAFAGMEMMVWLGSR